MDAEAKGLKGVANWFYVQFQEEQDHARIFMNYILSRDAEVKLLPIEEVRTAWTSPLEMFQDTLAHEKEVTAMINNLAAIAAEDKDYASSNMRLVRRRAGRGGGVGTRDDHRLRGRPEGNKFGLYMLDKELAAQTYAGFAAGDRKRINEKFLS